MDSSCFSGFLSPRRRGSTRDSADAWSCFPVQQGSSEGGGSFFTCAGRHKWCTDSFPGLRCLFASEISAEHFWMWKEALRTLGKRLVVQVPASAPAEDAARAWGWLHPMAVPCGAQFCSPPALSSAPHPIRRDPAGAGPGPAVSSLPCCFPGGISNRPLHGAL